MLLIPYMIVLWVLIHKKYIQDSYGLVDPPKLGVSSVTVTVCYRDMVVLLYGLIAVNMSLYRCLLML